MHSFIVHTHHCTGETLMAQWRQHFPLGFMMAGNDADDAGNVLLLLIIVVVIIMSLSTMPYRSVMFLALSGH